MWPVSVWTGKRAARRDADLQAARERARRNREWRIANMEWELELPGAEHPGPRPTPRIPTTTVRRVR